MPSPSPPTLRGPMLRRASVLFISTLILCTSAAIVPLAQRAGAPPERPGTRGGVTLLPNGWRIAPAGRSLQVGDFPMAMVLAADGRHVIVSNNGWSKPSLTIVDTRQ